MPMVPLQRNTSFCFFGGKRELLVLPAEAHRWGQMEPGRESRRGGSSRQTARRKNNSAAWQSARLPIQHPGEAASRSSPREPPGRSPAASPAGMLRRGTRSGPCMVLGGRHLRWLEDGLLSALLCSAGSGPRASTGGNCPRKPGQILKSNLAPCRVPAHRGKGAGEEVIS